MLVPVEQQITEKPKRPRVPALLWRKFKAEAILRGVGPEEYLVRLIEGHMAKSANGKGGKEQRNA